MYKTKPNLTKRILAAISDYGIIIVVAIIMLNFFGEKNSENEYTLDGFPAFFLFAFWIFWTAGIEQIFGQTFGNKIWGLEVRSLKNSTLYFGQSLKRHILSIFDLWPFGLLGILFIKNTKYNQRLGDLWAKTIVIDKNDPEQN